MPRTAMTRGPLDPRRVLGLPAIYRLLGKFGRTRSWRIFARDYINAQPGDRILDIGCGPADVLAELPAGIDYVGFDQSEHYIDSARQRHGARGQFFPGIVDLALVDRLGAASFDIVIAHGLLHHLDDREATEFFSLARAALRPGGRLVTADGCYLAGQSRIARLLLKMDRGRHVRTEAEYVALASQSFAAPRGVRAPRFGLSSLYSGLLGLPSVILHNVFYHFSPEKQRLYHRRAGSWNVVVRRPSC